MTDHVYASDGLPARSAAEPVRVQHPVRIIYLAFDSNDSRVLHRARTLEATGVELVVAAFHRTRTPGLTSGQWQTIDLGKTVDEDYRQRITSLLRASVILWGQRDKLVNTDGIIARNLEQLLLARLLRLISRRQVPLAYECLDVHGMLIGDRLLSRIVRAVERWCLKSCATLVVSSQAFVDEYFIPVQGFSGHWQLIENKFAPDFAQIVCRPTVRRWPGNRPLRIGWFGMLRCAKSFDLLMQIADARPDKIEIVIRGVPTVIDEQDFHRRIGERANVYFGNAYKNPEDLADIYADIDLTWVIDFFEEGFCSEWLLPNRLYESGFFGVPMVTRDGTATAAYVNEQSLGWSLASPLVEAFVEMLDKLTPHDYERKAHHIASRPAGTWVESDEAPRLVQHLTGATVAAQTSG